MKKADQSVTLTAVLTSYNYGKLLPATIESIIKQTVCPDEVIIIDDASTDNSPQVIESYSKRYRRIKSFSNPENIGVIKSLNRGIALATGKYILFVAADDPIRSRLVENSINILEKYPKAAFSSALSIRLDAKDRPMLEVLPEVPGKKEYYAGSDVFDVLEKQKFWLAGNTLICRLDCLNEVGGFREDLGPLCDSFAALLMALKYGVCFIPKYLSFWRRTDYGYSGKTLADIEMAMEYMRRTQELIQREYCKLFPAQFLERWQNEWTYASALSVLKNSKSEKGELQSQLECLLEPLLPIDTFAISFLLKVGAASAALARLYMAIRLGQVNYSKLLVLAKKVTRRISRTAQKMYLKF